MRDGEAGGGESGRRHRAFSCGRIWTVARGTLTQLVRMRALYFLGIFSVVLFAVAVLVTRLNEAEGALISLKSAILGAINVFTILFAVVGTAVLLPRDVEDRTLYTILSKPVPRIEYLIGKLLGLLLLIGFALLVMDLLFSGVLYWRQTAVLAEMEGAFSGGGIPAERMAEVRAAIAAQGVTWGLHAAVLALFMEAAVLAAVTLLLSTVASSTLFTVISGFAVFLIGLGQSTAREFFLDGALSGTAAKLLGIFAALIFPDFQMFNIVDGVVSGVPVAVGTVLKLGGLTMFYVVIYMTVAHLIFSEKEL